MRDPKTIVEKTKSPLLIVKWEHHQREIKAMLAILINCPNTKKLLHTGISMAPEIFETATLDHNSIECPHCSAMHIWDKKDAFLGHRIQDGD
jgi:hypothetical protein